MPEVGQNPRDRLSHSYRRVLFTVTIPLSWFLLAKALLTGLPCGSPCGSPKPSQVPGPSCLEIFHRVFVELPENGDPEPKREVWKRELEVLICLLERHIPSFADMQDI